MANDVTFKFGADNSEVKKSLNQVDKLAGDSASRLMTTLGVGLSGAGLVMLGKEAVKLAGNFEQTKVAYETMMGSTAKAEKMLDQLMQFSTVTPFEPDQVFAAGKQLLAFGIKAESIIPTLTKIGDISAGTGKDFNELASIFGKVFTKGKAQAEELNQMAEAGIPIIQTLADMYNKTGEEIYDMASKGQIGFSDISDAFDKMTQDGGKFGGMMQKQSETLNGVISTLVGNIKEAGRGIAEGWLPSLKEAAQLTNSIAKGVQSINKNAKLENTGILEQYATSFWDSVFDNLPEDANSPAMLGLNLLRDKWRKAQKPIGSEAIEKKEVESAQEEKKKRADDEYLEKFDKIRRRAAEELKKANKEIEKDDLKAQKEKEKLQKEADKKAKKEQLENEKLEKKRQAEDERKEDEKNRLLMSNQRESDMPMANALERMGASFGGAPNSKANEQINILKRIDKHIVEGNKGLILQ